MKGGADDSRSSQRLNITDAFISNVDGLRSYLKRFFTSSHDVEDVLQETYIRAVESEKLQNIDMPKAFLYKVSKNLALNVRASAGHRLVDSIEDFDELAVLLGKESLEDVVEQQNQFAWFCHAVKLLPPQCRRVFVLKKVYGLPNKEVAERLGISVSTVDKHLAKGLLMCRDHLERRGYELGGKRSKTAVKVKNA